MVDTMDSVFSWHDQTLAGRTVQALIKNGFDAVFVPDAAAASAKVMEHINAGTSVGFGGSMTIRALGLHNTAAEKGAVLLDHNMPGLTVEEKTRMKRAQLSCDLFLCSSNAVTEDGSLVNVDGSGNRVAAMTYGPKKIIVVAGINKIVADEAAGWERIRRIAAPMNSKRLGLQTPCTVTGICADCRSDSRICRIYSVIKSKPVGADFHIILVGESLGY